jgi:hypothetical protein
LALAVQPPLVPLLVILETILCLRLLLQLAVGVVAKMILLHRKPRAAQAAVALGLAAVLVIQALEMEVKEIVAVLATGKVLNLAVVAEAVEQAQ